MAISISSFLTIVAGIIIVFAGGLLMTFGLFQSALGRPFLEVIPVHAIAKAMIVIGVWIARLAAKK